MYRIRLNTVKEPTAYGLYLPARVLDGLGMRAGDHCELQVGRRVARVRVGAAPASRIAAELKQKLRLPAGVLRLHVERRGDRLHLGPFLGILARRQRSSPYGEQTGFFRRLIARAKAMHIYAFVFGPEDFAAAEDSVSGHRPYKTTTTWVTRRCPIPDVVFDRGFFRGVERVRARKLLNRLVQEYDVKLFNRDVGNKWDVYRILAADPALVRHLPETAKADEDMVADFIRRYRVVYVKPAVGNQGRNVFRIVRRGKRLTCRGHLRRGRLLSTSLAGPAALLQVLKETGEQSPFIVQRGLELARVQGRAADVRVLVQRDKTGRWSYTGAGVRIGGPASVVSNLHAGGSAAKLDVLVPRKGRKEKVMELESRIKELTLRVAEALSQGALLGELGIDLGLDAEGHLWIIEVNMRPGRATFRRAGLTEAWKRSGRAPLEFALHLWLQALRGDSELSGESIAGAEPEDGAFGVEEASDEQAGNGFLAGVGQQESAAGEDEAPTYTEAGDTSGQIVDAEAAGEDEDVSEATGVSKAAEAEAAVAASTVCGLMGANNDPAALPSQVSLGGYIPVMARILGCPSVAAGLEARPE